jgi:HAD superfamily hydrolase (TIGR01458 family)
MTRPAAVVLDMEGVLHVDWAPLPGAAAAVARLQEADIDAAVLTNTTGHSRAAIAERLAGMGIPIPAARVVTAASAAAEHLRRNHPGARVHALVEPRVTEELAGIELVDEPSAADVVLLGGPDASWTYARLDAVFRRLMGGAALVAMQRNRWWTTAGGPALDAGAFVAGLEYAADVRAVVTGKPAPGIFGAACAVLGADPSAVLMVGDDLDSDLRPAAALGMRTCLVRTGKGATFAPAAGELDLDVADLAAAVDALLA